MNLSEKNRMYFFESALKHTECEGSRRVYTCSIKISINMSMVVFSKKFLVLRFVTASQ